MCCVCVCWCSAFIFPSYAIFSMTRFVMCAPSFLSVAHLLPLLWRTLVFLVFATPKGRITNLNYSIVSIFTKRWIIRFFPFFEISTNSQLRGTGCTAVHEIFSHYSFSVIVIVIWQSNKLKICFFLLFCSNSTLIICAMIRNVASDDGLGL